MIKLTLLTITILSGCLNSSYRDKYKEYTKYKELNGFFNEGSKIYDIDTREISKEKIASSIAKIYNEIKEEDIDAEKMAEIRGINGYNIFHYLFCLSEEYNELSEKFISKCFKKNAKGNFIIPSSILESAIPLRYNLLHLSFENDNLRNSNILLECETESKVKKPNIILNSLNAGDRTPIFNFLSSAFLKLLYDETIEEDYIVNLCDIFHKLMKKGMILDKEKNVHKDKERNNFITYSLKYVFEDKEDISEIEYKEDKFNKIYKLLQFIFLDINLSYNSDIAVMIFDNCKNLPKDMVDPYLQNKIDELKEIKADNYDDKVKTIEESLDEELTKIIFNYGKTPLMYAAESGVIRSVELLLKKGANVNVTDNEGKTPLMYAAESGVIRSVELLLKKGANVNVTDNEGKTPLMHATKSAIWWPAVELLLKKGANVNVTDNEGKTPLMYAAESGVIRSVELLLTAGADVNVTDNEGKTPLMYAAESAIWWPAVELLLKKGANVNVTDNEGKTPLMYAAESAIWWPAVELLLKKGANVNVTDNEGKTPLMYAAESGVIRSVELLLEKDADVSVADNDGKTPLMYAAERRVSRSVELLLKKGADVSVADNDGKTPLMYAAESGVINSLELLLKAGADVNAADNDGKTPLMYAILNGSIRTCRMIIERGANLDAKDKEERNIYHYASISNNLRVFEFLLKESIKREPEYFL